MLEFQVTTLAGGAVARLRVPPEASGSDLLRALREALGEATHHHRLVVGDAVIDAGTRLESLRAREAGPIQATLVRTVDLPLAAVLGGADGALQIWDLERGEVVRALESHGGAVAFATVHWPTRRVLTGSSSGALMVWSLGGGAPIREVDLGFQAACASVDWSSSRALVGGGDGKLRLVDLEYGDVIQKLEGHALDLTVLGVTWDASLNLAITGGQDRVLRVWDVERGRTINELLGHCFPINCLAADFERQIAVSGSIAVVRIWRNILSRYTYYTDLEGHAGTVACLSVHFPTLRTVCGCSDGILRLWAEPKRLVFAARCAEVPITSVAAVWASQLFASADREGCVCLWDGRGNLKQKLSWPAGEIHCLAVCGLDVSEVVAEGLPDYCATSGAPVLLSIPEGRKGRTVFKVHVRAGQRDAQGHARPTAGELRQHLKSAYRLLYTDRLKFEREGSSEVLSDGDVVPASPAEVVVNGPDSVLQMLLLALHGSHLTA